LLINDEVQSQYAHKTGVDLSKEPPMEALDKAEWISIVASHRKDFFIKYPPFRNWPHALGRLQINPLYHEIAKDKSGNVSFEFRYPSEWYKYDNHNWSNYAPEKVQISKDALDAIANNTRTPEVKDLIAKWVVLGMPEHYLRPKPNAS
jgi:hypothetical protein